MSKSAGNIEMVHLFRRQSNPIQQRFNAAASAPETARIPRFAPSNAGPIAAEAQENRPLW